MPLALALDLGTTSLGAVALRADGSLAAQVRLPNDAGVPGLPSGHAEQNPHRLRELGFAALSRLASQLDDAPHCLGITGQMHGTLLLDARRRPLGNLITWQDRRADEFVPGTSVSYLATLLTRCTEAALAGTGCRPASGYLGTTLFTLLEQRQLPPALAKAAFLADWMAAELTGGDITTDPSNAASSGLYDLANRVWSAALLQAAGIDSHWLPPVAESGTVIGHITPEVAAKTGLPAGLPVCNAIGDNQAAVLGSVPSGAPAIQINVGTGGQINWPIPEFERLPGMDTRYLPTGRYMLVGAGLSGGDAYAWVNRTVTNWLEAFGVRLSSEEVYARVNALAASLAGPEGLACEPLFRGTRRQPDARGQFAGIRFDNFSVGHVARAVLDGVARGFYSFYEEAGEATPTHLSRIIGSGNGLRKNPLLVEALENVFQRPVWFPAHEDEAAYGAALLAGVNTGVWDNLQAAGGQIRLLRTHLVNDAFPGTNGKIEK